MIGSLDLAVSVSGLAFLVSSLQVRVMLKHPKKKNQGQPGWSAESLGRLDVHHKRLFRPFQPVSLFL